jgi:hypothetical protein
MSRLRSAAETEKVPCECGCKKTFLPIELRKCSASKCSKLVALFGPCWDKCEDHRELLSRKSSTSLTTPIQIDPDVTQIDPAKGTGPMELPLTVDMTQKDNDSVTESPELPSAVEVTQIDPAKGTGPMELPLTVDMTQKDNDSATESPELPSAVEVTQIDPAKGTGPTEQQENNTNTISSDDDDRIELRNILYKAYPDYVKSATQAMKVLQDGWDYNEQFNDISIVDGTQVRDLLFHDVQSNI